jgi:nucleotidyltransferase/DNA polymerase involved in DNA repair
LKLRELHEIGYRTESKLAAEGLETVRDVWDLGDQGEGELCRILGIGLGKKIFMCCKGKYDRQVKPTERKSNGAEVRSKYVGRSCFVAILRLA